MKRIDACPACLRRSRLLQRLASSIDKVCADRPGKRTPELLALGNEDLVAATCRSDGDDILEEVLEATEASMVAEITEADCWARCRHSEDWPDGLLDGADAPRCLIGRGDSIRLGEVSTGASVTVVGARRATSYGLEMARSISHELSAAGLLVVSGMALGIDGAAHRGALEAGPTVAVLGCGVDRPYPVSHTRLYRNIVESGLVISEFPPGTQPWKWTFPARNRIMAALSQMTVVVEAARRSGSLITAEMAADAGREVGAVPGQVTSLAAGGTNELISSGAALIRDGRDVIDRVIGVGAPAPRPTGPNLSPEAKAVLEAVADGFDTCEAVSVKLGLETAEVEAELARLEVAGYLACSLLGQYIRTGLGTTG